jgi:cytochrome c biogenesis protein
MIMIPWRFFCSVKLTLFLLVGLAAVSIIGTLIPQNAAQEIYVERYGAPLARFFLSFNFTDMYHSWWFYFLLTLLTLNIIACSLRRFRYDWKMITAPIPVLDEGQEKSLPCATTWMAASAATDVEPAATDFLRREFAEPRVTRAGSDVHLFAQKQSLGRLGVYVLHSSIVLILIGVVIGSLFGFSKAFVEIEEKGSVTTAYSPMGEPIDLGFTVRCEDFSVSFYDSGAPKEYRSVLSVVDGGKTVVDRRPVVVNHPLTYRGIAFYQSGYKGAAFLFSVRDRKTGKTSRLNVRAGERALLPNGDQLVVMESIDEIRLHSPRYSGPAAHVAVLSAGGNPESFILLKAYPEVNAERGGAYQISYEGVSAWTTVLQVTKDPGVWVVWAGCFFLIVGFGMVFLMSHRRIWVRFGDGRIVMAGSSARNQAAFRIFFDELAEKLKTACVVPENSSKP